MRIAVLMGGDSEERDVSLASGCQVSAALRDAGHEVVAVDTLKGVLSPEKERKILETGVRALPPTSEHAGEDMVRGGGATALVKHPTVSEAEIFFLALHGGAGEDGTLQTMLEAAGLPYVGSGPTGCRLASDKDLSKRLLRDGGINTPAWITGETEPERVIDTLGLPVMVKPVSGGSSIHLTLAHDLEELIQGVADAKLSPGPLMYEAYVKGREFTVGIVGDTAMPVGEIIPKNEFFDYQSKYQPGMADEIFPADISDDLSEELKALALRVHRLLRLDDFSRVDFIVDQTGETWVLEANALPGMSSNSLIPKAARAAGLSFADLCDRITRIAVDRIQRRPADRSAEADQGAPSASP